MAEPDQSVIISVPTSWTPSMREVFAEEVIDFIQTRTESGLDINNKPFKAYADSYKDSTEFQLAGKGNTVDLQFTSDMLFSLEMLSQGRGFVRIGAGDQFANDKIAFNKAKGRQFLGVNSADRRKLINRVEAAFGV